MITQSKLIKKISDLYLIQRGHYLVQYKEPIGYRQYKSGQMVNDKKVKSLMDWQLEKHLQGEFTVGTFGGKVMTKFMTFDVDFHNPEMAKWITYKVVKSLEEFGIQQYYISYSGGKGYHIEIFFETLIQIEHAERFFNLVVVDSDITSHSDAGNKVEFRVSEKMGVKLPLGFHQKTGNYCGFCLIENELQVMSKEASESYVFTIKKMKSETILDILGVREIETYDKNAYVKTEDAISPHRSLANYEQSEDYSIDRAQDLLINGLKFQGSRNNSLFLIGLYLKYQGLDKEQCKQELHVWMDWQNPNIYTTSLEVCHKEIAIIVENIYNKNYNLSCSNKDLAVSLEEINWIIDKCPDKNQKLIAYAMLIHSKRHANMQGVFYMPYPQIAEATGIGEATAFRQVEKLIEYGIVEVVERNRKPKCGGLNKKLPNLYRLNYIKSQEDSLSEHEKVFITDNIDSFDSCLGFYFTLPELKKRLPRRHYESLSG